MIGHPPQEEANPGRPGPEQRFRRVARGMADHVPLLGFGLEDERARRVDDQLEEDDLDRDERLSGDRDVDRDRVGGRLA